jgi:diaminohydroxyphosphoribosylaminopyrimidine deaminase / 5-amino-6-(5-phosphoribosylamino)uracil reductase
MKALAERGVQTVLVEPGPHLAAAMLSQGIADEIRVYIAPKILGSKGAASIDTVLSGLPHDIELEDIEVTQFGSDARIRAMVHRR